ncbi:MAG: HYR domain-containing protein, partial [Ilumatobacteraceae bacterium]
FTGIGSMRIDGTLDSAGNGSLAVAVPSLTIGRAQITNGAFAIVRNGSTISLSARGTFSLFGNSLEVVQASLTLSRIGTANDIAGSLVIRPPGGAALTLGGWGLNGTLRLTFSGITSSISIENGAVTIPGWGSVGVTAQISVPAVNGSFFELVLPTGGLRLGGGTSPFFATGTFRLSFDNNVATLSATNPGVKWKDGATTLANITAPSVTVSSNGSVSVSMNTFATPAVAGFSFTVPSLRLEIDAQGLNARLALGAGSATIPGFPTITTPAIDIGTASTFSKTLVADHFDLGFISLHGTLVFERQDGVFRLRFQNSSTGAKPFLRLTGLVDVPLPTFTVATNGTFVVDASFPTIGPDGFQIIGAAMHLEKTGAALTSLAGSVTGGKLLIGTSEPIVLPTLSFDTSNRLDKTFTIPNWDLGPFLSVTSASFRFQQLAGGVLRFELTNQPTVSMFAGSSSLRFNDLLIESDGTFDGSITGRLALFGTKLATATFDVSKSGDLIKVNLPASRKAGVDLFSLLHADLSGFAKSDGSFSFTGSASVSLGVTGFSFSGSTSVTVSSADGISGDFNGRVCIGFCLTTGGTLRSDGRIKGFFQFDINGDGDFNDFGDFNADWRVYLADGAVRIDINRDSDYDDIGDISIGNGTSADQVQPTMAQPPNITVNANIGTGGRVRVYYPTPIATDSGTNLTVTCAPASGSSFGLGSTTVTCSATDRGNNTRTRTFTVSVVASATSATPTANNGATVTVIATGFLPGSIVYAKVQSEPVYLGVFTADANGNVTIDVVIPAGLPAGEHDIIVEGFSPNGAVYQYVQPIVVGDPTQLPAPTTVPRGLPATGGDGGAAPLLPMGALSILLGILVLWWRRRYTAFPSST